MEDADIPCDRSILIHCMIVTTMIKKMVLMTEKNKAACI